jgi:hypothetical protein
MVKKGLNCYITDSPPLSVIQQVLLKKFIINHRRTIAYHPQENGVVESLNKMLHKGLTKICDIDKNDWDVEMFDNTGIPTEDEHLQ